MARLLTTQPRRAKTRRSAGKAAASEMPRRTFQYVEALSDARTQLAVIFNNLNERGRPVSTGILRSTVHVELSGSRKSSGKM